MAQQTINIGASPNDGTGTPLRTAFQSTNSNFTELYTATGPSGNNIVVPGNATITGALTVDTTTLVVDPANNRVGVGTATPALPLEIYKASGDSKMRITSGANSLTIGWDDPNGFYYTANTSLMAWQLSSGTAMTLNATGLAIGGTALGKLTIKNPNVSGEQNIFKIQGATSAGDLGGITYNQTDDMLKLSNITSSGYISFGVGPSSTERLRINSSGNVGIGVTPSAWGSTFKALQLSAGSIAADGTVVIEMRQNSFWNGSANVYVNNGFASNYYQYNGTHAWFTAPSGTAGNAVTFTQAMTLDASGNLLVGATSALASGSTFQNLGASRQVLTLKGDAFGSYTAGIWNASTTNDGLFVYFGTEAALTVRGGISYNRGGGLVAYNTTSDYRAKDIIGPVSNSGSLVDSLKVYIGKMHGATIARPMLIAHEAQEVAPYAVTGTKDEVDADGNPKYQQMDVSALVPVLIAEIQSLRARVQTLETR